MASENLPIDIHSGKLLDWLVSRRHCNKDWQKNVLTIREKIKQAILDMPESEEIVRLLQGSYINYFHCQRIIEILRETEKDTKNFLGYYSSQRMKDWQEVESLYKKDNVNLAESAQILQRLVQYEIPALRRQITKSEQSITDSSKKEKDYVKQSEDAKKAYEKELQRIGIAGSSLRAELLALAADLPAFFEEISKEIVELSDARNAYVEFRKYLQSFGTATASEVLPLIGLLISKGPSTTAFEWKYGEAPTRIEKPNFDLLLKEDKKEDENDDIDFGDDDIDFGDENADDIDFGDDVHIDIVADDSGAVGDRLACGEDALSLLENADCQKSIKDELSELAAFLSMRRDDEEREIGSDVFVRGFEKRPDTVAKVNVSQLTTWITKISGILQQLTNENKQNLFKIRSSPQYVENLVEELEMKRGMEKRYMRMRDLTKERGKEAVEQLANAESELKKVAESTRQLQKQMESAISAKYNGRRVNIMGGINQALAGI